MPFLHFSPTPSKQFQPVPQKEKVVVVMGATGTGKSRLSIDLATRFAAETMNSDKRQVYQGLDIATNKITDEERCGVPHHLLGIVDPESDFSTANFPQTLYSKQLQRVPQKKKVVVIMGPTGTGKSRLSIDLATRFAAEIINSDKIQVYQGLDIATNKITDEERCGVPHHLLGILDPESDFSAANFPKSFLPNNFSSYLKW